MPTKRSSTIAEKDLRRELGFWDALTIGVGTMIGAGIFLLASRALELTGPSAILSFLAAGMVCAMTAASTAELATGMPKSGGDYYFVSRSLGPMFGAISGVGIWLSLTFAIAFYLVGMGEYVIQVFHQLGNRFDALSILTRVEGPVIPAMVGGALLALLNVIGAKQSGRTQFYIVVVLLAILGIITTVGFVHVDPSSFRPFRNDGTMPIFETIALVFVSFLGFVKIAAVSEEIKNPSVNLPRTLIGSVLIVTILYVCILVVMAGMWPQISDAQDPLSAAGRIMFGPLGAIAIITAGLLATISSANASILAASRINLAMARDRMAPGLFSKIHKTFLTPHRAIAITGVLAMVFITLDDLALLAQIASVLQLYSYAALNIGCIVLRAANPDWYRPSYRAPGYPFMQIFAAGACLTIIVLSDPISIIAVIALIIMSLAWYFVIARKNVEITHSLPALKERTQSIGLISTFFYTPTESPGAETAETATPIAAKRNIEPYSARRVAVALANPDTERSLLQLAMLIARGKEEGGEVYGLHVVRVPIQTTLDAARTRMEDQDSVQRIRSLIEDFREEAADDSTAPKLSAHPSVAHDPFGVLQGDTVALGGDMLLMGWEGGFNIGRIYESPVQGLIRDATCDMGMLKDRGLDVIDDILLPWGGGVHARLGLEVATRIARNTGATVHLLRVVKQEVDVEAEEKRIVQSVTEIVDEVIDRGEVEVVYHVQRANRVTDGIKSQLDSAPADLVIIGASREFKMRNVLFGAIPDVVADQAPCSVLMVRRYLPEHWSFTATQKLKSIREDAGFTTSPEED